MPVPYVARHTRLHPQLWGPYKITAYPHGFHDWPESLAEPVWEPAALMIRGGRACFVGLGDQPTLHDALDACWQHLASLTPLTEAA